MTTYEVGYAPEAIEKISRLETPWFRGGCFA